MLLICGLINDTNVSSLDYLHIDQTMGLLVNNRSSWLWKEVVVASNEVLSFHFHEGTGANHKITVRIVNNAKPRYPLDHDISIYRLVLHLIDACP
jgi:hypothetical protein